MQRPVRALVLAAGISLAAPSPGFAQEKLSAEQNVQLPGYSNVVARDNGPDWQTGFQVQFMFPK